LSPRSKKQKQDEAESPDDCTDRPAWVSALSALIDILRGRSNAADSYRHLLELRTADLLVTSLILALVAGVAMFLLWRSVAHNPAGRTFVLMTLVTSVLAGAGAAARVAWVVLQPRSVVQSAPGRLPLMWLRTFSSRSNYEQIYSQIVADMREEYFDALAAGELWRAKFVRLRGYYSLLNAACLGTLVRWLARAKGFITS
jgi:hypothetical protein